MAPTDIKNPYPIPSLCQVVPLEKLQSLELEYPELSIESEKLVLDDRGESKLPELLGVLHRDVIELICKKAEGQTVLFLDKDLFSYHLDNEHNPNTERAYMTIMVSARIIVIPKEAGPIEDVPSFLWSQVGHYGVLGAAKALREYRNKNYFTAYAY